MIYTYLLIITILFLLELCYFRIATRFNIIDRPQKRSSHNRITIRGGGIIFIAASLIWFFAYGMQYPYFTLGLVIVSAVSFWDDLKTLSVSIRMSVQIISVLLILCELFLSFEFIPWIFLILFVLSIFIINSYNFMDGINGITCGYTFVVLTPLLYLNKDMYFVDMEFIVVTLLANIVFCFFNFRKEAKCFAGDVGAISIGFIVAFIVCRLISNTNDFTYITLFLVYGTDTLLTILHRIILKENITTPHRKHIYQIMSNELKIPQLQVTTIYMLLQSVLSVGFFLIPRTVIWHWSYFLSASVVLCAIYLWFIKKYYHLHREYLETQTK